MIKITRDRALRLHTIMAEMSGGGVGIRDEGLLESALESAFAGFGDYEVYPTIEEKGARLGYSLISNHAFIDGNKRIGLLCMFVFMEMNSAPLICSDEELITLGLSAADGSMDYEDILAWVRAHRG